MADMIEIPKIDPGHLRESFPVILGGCEYFDIGAGWRMVVSRMCVTLQAMPPGAVTIRELSQKLGGLRVTMDTSGLTTEQDIVARHAKVLAEERSRYRCEVCGHPGFISKPPENQPAAWIHCLCHRHLPRDRRGWPLDRRERRYRIGEVHWKFDDLLDRLRVDEPGNA
jgi:hypothetical protein